MNAKLTLARPRVVTTVAAAVLSTVIAIGLLTAVTGLFQRDGAPFEQVVIAEHACANHAFISEREAVWRLLAVRSQIIDRRRSTHTGSRPRRKRTLTMPERPSDYHETPCSTPPAFAPRTDIGACGGSVESQPQLSLNAYTGLSI